MTNEINILYDLNKHFHWRRWCFRSGNYIFSGAGNYFTVETRKMFQKWSNPRFRGIKNSTRERVVCMIFSLLQISVYWLGNWLESTTDRNNSSWESLYKYTYLYLCVYINSFWQVYIDRTLWFFDWNLHISFGISKKNKKYFGHVIVICEAKFLS